MQRYLMVMLVSMVVMLSSKLVLNPDHKSSEQSWAQCMHFESLNAEID